jgi:hypothetical protein
MDTDENEDKSKDKNDAGNAEVTGSRRESIKNIKATRQACASSDPTTPRCRRSEVCNPDQSTPTPNAPPTTPPPSPTRGPCSGMGLARALALARARTLPRSRTRPWPRSYTSLQATYCTSASPAHEEQHAHGPVRARRPTRLRRAPYEPHAPLPRTSNLRDSCSHSSTRSARQRARPCPCTPLCASTPLCTPALAHAPRLEPQGASQSNRKKSDNAGDRK